MIQFNFKNREIKNNNCDSNTQSLGFEAMEHLRNRMCKENCRKHL